MTRGNLTVSLKEALKKFPIKISEEDFLTIENIQGILQSGVKEVVLKYDSDSSQIKIEGDFHSICCTDVKVSKISNRGHICKSIPETRTHIEGGHWIFPCPSYKYSEIKRNLEKAIQNILGIQKCKVKSFNTDIIEYDN